MKTILLRTRTSEIALRVRKFAARLTACSLLLASSALFGQATAPKQANDEEYTKKIKEYLSDPRIHDRTRRSSSRVVHGAHAAEVPRQDPRQARRALLHADIDRYYEALAKDSPRAKYWKHRQDRRRRATWSCWPSATKRRSTTSTNTRPISPQLTDPRKTTEERAQKIIHTEQADLLDHQRHPLSGDRRPADARWSWLTASSSKRRRSSRAIRNNVIVFITPVVETDGRDKDVDTYYYGKETQKPEPPLMYWGKYVAARQQSRRHGPVSSS